MLKKNIIFTILFFFSFNSIAVGNNYYYQVKKNESLSTILSKMKLFPIYGNRFKKGYLQKITKLNKKNISNKDIIFPGQKIYFSKELVNLSLAANTISVQADSEIKIVLNETKLQMLDEKFQKRNISSDVDSLNETSEVKKCLKYENINSENKENILKEPFSSDMNHEINFYTKYRFSTYSSRDITTGTNAVLTSKTDLELGSSWLQNWTNSFGTYFQFSIRNIDFNKPSSQTKTLADKNYLLSKVQLGAFTNFSNSTLKYYLNYGNQLFLRGTSSNELNFDSVFIPALGINYDYTIFRKSTTQVKLYFSTEYLSGSKIEEISIKNGSQVNLGVLLKYSGKKTKYELGVGYNQVNQNTSIVNQISSDIYSQFSFSMPIFDQ